MRETSRPLFFLLLLFFAAPPLLSAAPARQVAGQAEAEVRKLEREWLDAYEKFDAAAMDRIVAEGFTITFPDGRVQRKPQLMAQTRAPRRDAGPSAPRFRTEGVGACVYGDTVVLTGLVVSEWQQDGKAVGESQRYTDTYVRLNGRWQVVASHLSNVPKKK